MPINPISTCKRVALLSDFRLESLKTNNILKQTVDLIELRLDVLRSVEPEELRKCVVRVRDYYDTNYPFIITLRHSSEYGHWNSDESRRLDCYLALLPEAQYIDVEANAKIALSLSEATAKANKKLILSWHGALKACNYKNLLDKAHKLGAAYCKVACMTNTLDAVFILADMMPIHTERMPAPIIMGMGLEGPITRVLLPWLGSKMVYGFCQNQSLVQGQISIGLINECFSYLRYHVDLDCLLRAIRCLHGHVEYNGAVNWDSLEQKLRDKYLTIN